jgi:hypothetical protein
MTQTQKLKKNRLKDRDPTLTKPKSDVVGILTAFHFKFPYGKRKDK